MASPAVATILQTLTDDVGSTLSTVIPIVLVITGALIALTFLVRFVRRNVR